MGQNVRPPDKAGPPLKIDILTLRAHLLACSSAVVWGLGRLRTRLRSSCKVSRKKARNSSLQLLRLSATLECDPKSKRRLTQAVVHSTMPSSLGSAINSRVLSKKQQVQEGLRRLAGNCLENVKASADSPAPTPSNGSSAKPNLSQPRLPLGTGMSEDLKLKSPK